MCYEFSTESGVPDIIREMAEVAADMILPHFRAPMEVENKLAQGLTDADMAFDPVTIADRNAEAALRRLINQRFPGHGILGEEYGAENLHADYVWVLDPIDGTRSFVSGLPLWGTLIALCHQGRPVLGAMIQPYLAEIYVGAGRNAWLASIGGERPLLALAARPDSRLASATLFTTDPGIFNEAEHARYDMLQQRCRIHRYGLDCYGYAMVGAGFGDLAVEAGLQIYDIAALIPLIEAAGGVVTNWQGKPVEELQQHPRLQILASANPHLHSEALEILK